MTTDALSRTFQALADPTRRSILARLAEVGEASVAELAAPFDLTQRAISKHVGVLEEAGLVARSRDAQRRPSRLRVEPLTEVDRWLDGYRGIWDERFAALREELARDEIANHAEDATDEGKTP
ncbi:ArsR family transcriptional regulator [Agromyces ramosus]|jgi:DNA-binding transcriptional ArsR family regulator|uniref:ArsR family transcriptional regulator n=1 Tax=Agromyces ramosus TaxID=33879 RepID=A0A4Q7MJG1_9MICO|nr:metalloregulator ArsR/SmtB family transcription factor [Agromyces ramosus]RZS68364.1 ArsR family transcriptional regulator [Agromyces ramosus]